MMLLHRGVISAGAKIRANHSLRKILLCGDIQG
jgi:hypothetical protein